MKRPSDLADAPLPSDIYPAIEGPRSDAWTSLTREIRACRRCPLGARREHAVAYRGSERPWVVFVGEAPGAEEDRAARPFVGRGGRILDRAIADAGLGAGDFGIVNLLKCRPPANRFDPLAARVCRPYLERQIEILAPRALVSLGRHALRSLDPSAPPMMSSAGIPRIALGRPLFPLVHPAATLRAGRLARRWESDRVAFGTWLAELRQQSA